MEKRVLPSHQNIFCGINYEVSSLVEPLLSRNFCQKSVRENFRNFHTVISRLPETSYVKMIDVWLIFTMFIPFYGVISSAIRDFYQFKIKLQEELENKVSVFQVDLDKNEAKEESETNYEFKLELLSVMDKFVLPLIFTTFFSAYFAYGIYLSYTL